ncbi:MAG: hypothetical protein ACTSQY_10080 [Candidatus Odinarchaeia archaeon]
MISRYNKKRKRQTSLIIKLQIIFNRLQLKVGKNMQNENREIVSGIYEVPGSSFKIQIVKKKQSTLIKIYRGPKLSKEIELKQEEATKQNIVTIIQSELFMPISPFKISKEVENALADIKKGGIIKEEQAETMEEDSEHMFKGEEGGPSEESYDKLKETLTPAEDKPQDTTQKKHKGKREPTILSLLEEMKKEDKEEKELLVVKDEDIWRITTGKYDSKEKRTGKEKDKKQS